jgi:NADH-quinone oxidoreductase subunit A
MRMNLLVGFLLFVSAGIITLGLWAASWVIGPRRKSPLKDEPFECGVHSEGYNQERIPVKFYLVAILFVLFDIEVVFLYPWAVRYKQLGWFGLIEMAVFIGILFVGLLYTIRRKALDWK